MPVDFGFIGLFLAVVVALVVAAEAITNRKT
jgi:hypothetical protein